MLSWALLGLGMVWITHSVPFHASASVNISFDRYVTPVAVQAVADEHDTLLRLFVPLGLGVDWIVHSVPFHRSARVLSKAPVS